MVKNIYISLEVSMKLFTFIFIFIFYILPSDSHAAKRISGDELKLLVQDWLKNNGIKDSEPKFKKGITFPYCSGDIHIKDKYGDMRTVELQCLDKKGWKYIVRTGLKKRKITSNKKNSVKRKKVSKIVKGENVVVLKRKLYEGQIITEEDLSIVKRKIRKNDNAFSSIELLLGRRVEKTIEANRIIREKDLARKWVIVQDQPVIIESSHKTIKVTSEGIAMESGMVGDLISIKNDSSGNIIKAWVQTKKKVSTNP